jgi:hypothetical protein
LGENPTVFKLAFVITEFALSLDKSVNIDSGVSNLSKSNVSGIF